MEQKIHGLETCDGCIIVANAIARLVEPAHALIATMFANFLERDESHVLDHGGGSLLHKQLLTNIVLNCLYDFANTPEQKYQLAEEFAKHFNDFLPVLKTLIGDSNATKH